MHDRVDRRGHDQDSHDHTPAGRPPTEPRAPHDSHATGHTGAPAASAPAAGSWQVAVQATLHCLTGCAIGEVLGLVIGTWLAWSTGATIALAIVLAFFFGYALTLRGVRRAGVDWRTGVRLALAADTLSIAVMELVDNAVILAVPGAMDAGLVNLLFWGSLAASLAIAFVVTVPVNKWMIDRGRGHAVVHHAYHH